MKLLDRHLPLSRPSTLLSRVSRLLHILLIISLLTVLKSLAQQARVSQLSDEQVIEFYRRAQASGLNEMQIEQAAMSQGFTLTDIAKMRQRIAKLRLPSGQSPDRTELLKSDTLINRTQQGNLSHRLPLDSLPFFLFDTIKKPVIFGASLFQNAKLSFEPNLRIPTPRNYLLGPDDELIVEIYGNSTDNFRLRVSPEGSVRVPGLNLGPIIISGLPIEQAEQRIVGRLRQAYQGLNRPGSGTYATITLGNIRSIRVTLVGEVVRPGTYTISSLATALNALYLAGGPNPETGSFREVKVIRGNQVIATLDLYDYLTSGIQRNDVRLQEQDVIRVSDFRARVEMAGEVKRPAIYEVKPGETLTTLVRYAGGFTDKAYTASITLRRNTPRELRISTLAQEQMATFNPQAGDKFTIGQILSRYENRIQLTGAVMRPGEYALEDIKTLRSLIKRAEGLRKDAFLHRGIIYRERENMDLETIPFDVGQLMRNEVEDLPLIRQDSVHIYSVRELRESYSVIIQGAVNEPDTFPFITNMSISDLIVRAGGFQEGATPTRIEVARRIREDTSDFSTPENIKIFLLNIDRNLKLNPSEAGFVLQPFDIIYVRTSPQYETQQSVYLAGEVIHPGNYPIHSRSERVSDLIQRAGGLKPQAFLPGARFSRKGEAIATDLRAILENPGIEGNLLLENMDSLLIPKRQEIVRIQGAVLNPSTVNFSRDFRFKDYITQAGGYTENALKRRAYVTYANGLKDRSKRILFFTNRPRIEPGSEIIVPFVPMEEGRKLTPTERLGVFSLIGTLAATTATILINLLRSPQ